MAVVGKNQPKWWKEAVVYQIYPSSFKDSNGDGWGDVKGIISKLDYLRELGIDVVWVSPIYKSPMADMGYDISDYKCVDPVYGTNDDVDVLIAELKRRGMKLMMDLVVNHTSNQHAWFLESRSSISNPKRSWYIWRPPRGYTAAGVPLPPNNWSQILGEANSAWTYDSTTKEFYLSIFTPEQPDLDWENPDVREAVHDIMHYWLKKGVAGYRMDVINLISKVRTFPDAPEILGPGHDYHPGVQYFANGPRLHEFLHEIHDKVLVHYDSITVGEMPEISDVGEILRTVGANAGELNMIFIFDIVDIDNVPGLGVKFALHPWTTNDLAAIVIKWQRAMYAHDGWNSVFIENHDQPRSVSRYTDDSDRWRSTGAKLLALMQTTLAGTLFVFQGEELGMRNAPASWDPDLDYRDIEGVNFWKKAKRLYAADPAKLAAARTALARKARDHARTPMPWSAAPNAGFCDEGVRPWMRVIDDYTSVNAAAQMADHASHEAGISVFRFWQACLRNRRAKRDVLVYGDFEVLCDGDDDVFAYTRSSSSSSSSRETWVTVLHFGKGTVEWTVPATKDLEIRMANWADTKLHEKNKVLLRDWEGLVGVLKPANGA